MRVVGAQAGSSAIGGSNEQGRLFRDRLATVIDRAYVVPRIAPDGEKTLMSGGGWAPRQEVDFPLSRTR
jgi:hypothetical protein